MNIFFKENEQQIIERIHNEFDTAEDRLLKQADDLLKELTIPTETSIEQKAKRLNAIGFINVPEVHQSKRLEEIRKERSGILVKTKEQANLIKHYKRNYPFQKFLTVEELDRICVKYGLNYAPVKNYIKDIPEKNLSEIERAKSLDALDQIHAYKTVRVTKFWHDVPKDLRDFLKTSIPYKSKYRYDDGDLSESNVLYSAQLAGYKGDFTGYIYSTAEIETVDNTGLFICAPPSHFDTAGLTKKGLGFFKVTKKEIKDPIVFRYCRGGVQVLSKWGLEASDPLLLNEIEN